jgi:hypothetical protein
MSSAGASFLLEEVCGRALKARPGLVMPRRRQRTRQREALYVSQQVDVRAAGGEKHLRQQWLVE